MKILISFTVLSIFALISWIFLNPRISLGSDGITVSLPQVSFYVPNTTSVKIYKFDPRPLELVNILQNNTRDYPGTFGIYIKNISTGQEVSLNANTSFNAASLYKLAVMYTIYKKGVEGKLNLSNPNIQNNLQQMITVSSNEAAYYLVKNHTSWKEVTKMMQELGLKNTTLNQDPSLTTPLDMGKLLVMMAQGKLLNMETSVAMMEVMLEQKRRDRIPVNLPPNALIANKTGELWDSRHDAGVIISPENNFILVLMSKDSENPEKVKPIMAKISYEVYDFFQKQWANPPEIL